MSLSVTAEALIREAREDDPLLAEDLWVVAIELARVTIAILTLY
jgi:hypothetical protein